MKIREGFMLREVAGSNIVVPVGALSEDFNGMVTLNATGSFIWKHLQTETNEEAIVGALLATYDIDESRARIDVNKFLAQMKENNLLERE